MPPLRAGAVISAGLPPACVYSRAEIAAFVLLQALNRQGWKAVAVHGDASQAQRTAAVDSFKVGSSLRAMHLCRSQHDPETAQRPGHLLTGCFQ